MTHVYQTPLSLDDFNALLDVHGADLSRWPVEAVKPALALMDEDAQAKALFAQTENLDDALRRADAVTDLRIAARHGKTAPDLQARIMAQIAQGAQAVPAVVAAQALGKAAAARGMFGLKTLFAPGGGLLMVGLVGFMMGFMQPASAQDTLLDGLVHGQDIVIAGDVDTGTMGEWE